MDYGYNFFQGNTLITQTTILRRLDLNVQDGGMQSLDAKQWLVVNIKTNKPSWNKWLGGFISVQNCFEICDSFNFKSASIKRFITF